MQNDFVTGSLANKDAEKIIPNIKNEIGSYKYEHIMFTRDTHNENYLSTPEGQSLPIKHCIWGTYGWQIHEGLLSSASHYTPKVTFLNKPTFGTIGLLSHIESCGDFDEVVLCGTCTDICVISNALILKTLKPTLKVTVIADACAGLTPEKHNAALEVMKSCQINVI